MVVHALLIPPLRKQNSRTPRTTQRTPPKTNKQTNPELKTARECSLKAANYLAIKKYRGERCRESVL